MDPLTVATALRELINPRLIHGRPARNAKLLSNVLRDLRKSEFSHRRSPDWSLAP
jgi:hypothetical protein